MNEKPLLLFCGGLTLSIDCRLSTNKKHLVIVGVSSSHITCIEGFFGGNTSLVLILNFYSRDTEYLRLVGYDTVLSFVTNIPGTTTQNS